MSDARRPPQIGLRWAEVGTVVSLADGIAWIAGVPGATVGEILGSDQGSRAWVFQLDEQLAGCIILDAQPDLAAGLVMRRLGQKLSLPCSKDWTGRVLDPLGRPLDGLPAPQDCHLRPIEGPSPPITARDAVTRPIYSGNTVIDTLLPMARGQRELLIGDEGTGKSAIALDAIIAQKGQGVLCVLVLIAQRRSEVADVLRLLRENDAMAHTTVMVAEASSLTGLQYLAPFSGCALAESWMHAGADTLIVYDDLGKHALAYRELCLLLRRTPGREAYPGDVFYLHSRLLERSTQLSAELGGGSMTALPIVPTQLGEVAAYIPTNLISITDGQVYLSTKWLSSGMFPAIDVGTSVSRIGGRAQDPAIARECKRLRLDYLQFLELELFTRFGTHLDDVSQARMARGRLLQSLFRQPRLEPRAIAYNMAWLIALNEGWLDALDPQALQQALQALREALARAPELHANRSVWVQWVHDTLEPGA